MKILKKCLAILFTVFLSFTLFLPDFASGSSDPDTQDSLPISDLIPDISFSDVNIGVLMVPFYSTKESDIFASQLLVMASAQSADDTRELFEANSFEVLGQYNYDKDVYDPSHTCAYTIGKGRVLKGLNPVDALLVSIRGTSGGEWYSDFDFCPSRNEDTVVSENFLCAASECFLNLKDFIDKEDENQLIILCGHSRGAACANLLGVLLNEYIDPSRVYSYTYACPATIRSGSFSAADQNIFNFINPADLIPMTPFAQWGFKRAGTDIILSGYDSEAASDAGRYAGIMASLAPTISSYYNDRHALDRAGLSDSGITSFEIMLYICTALIDLTETVSKGSSDTMDHKNISDLEKIISEDSDLYALLDIYKELAADNYQKGIDLLSQHLPTTYLQLLGVAF